MLAKGNFQGDEGVNREFSSESQFHAVVWGWAIPKSNSEVAEDDQGVEGKTPSENRLLLGFWGL